MDGMGVYFWIWIPVKSNLSLQTNFTNIAKPLVFPWISTNLNWVWWSSWLEHLATTLGLKLYFDKLDQKHVSCNHMDVSENSGTPKSSILIGFPL